MGEVAVEWLVSMVTAGLVSRGVETTEDAERPAIERWVAEVRAQALRDAADEFAARLPDGTGNGRAYNSHRVAAMLRAEADRIEKEADDDDGFLAGEMNG